MKKYILFLIFYFWFTLSCLAKPFDKINSNEDFRKYLLQNIKILNDTNASDYEKVSAVRKWASTNIPACDMGMSIPDTCLNWKLATIDDIYKTFNKLSAYKGGFVCGGSALMLEKIYNILGYKSQGYNYGYKGTSSTHVITLVRINHKNKIIWSIQDPWVNNSIEYKKESIDFYHLISLLENKEIADVYIEQGDKYKKLLTYKTLENSENCRINHKQKHNLDKSKQYCFMLDIIKHLNKNWVPETLDIIKKKYKADSLLYAFLDPIQGYYPNLDY